MHAAFGTVLVVVCSVSAVVAVVLLVRSGRTWQEYGKRGLLMERDVQSDPGQREEEIQQLLDARNASRARRGEPAVDGEVEIESATEKPSRDRRF